MPHHLLQPPAAAAQRLRRDQAPVPRLELHPGRGLPAHRQRRHQRARAARDGARARLAADARRRRDDGERGGFPGRSDGDWDGGHPGVGDGGQHHDRPPRRHHHHAHPLEVRVLRAEARERRGAQRQDQQAVPAADLPPVPATHEWE